MSVRFESVVMTTGQSATLTLVTGEKIAGIIPQTTWTAADIGFMVSKDAVTFYNVVDPARGASTSYARCVNVAADTYMAVPSVCDIELGMHYQFTSLNTASNAQVSQTRTLLVAIELSF